MREREATKTAVVGLGYVGLPLSLQFARSGVKVLGLDVDAAKVDALHQGRSYIDVVLIATHHACINYQELADWTECIVDTRNAMAGISTLPGQVWKA
jgi:UDP-N-acetyl-D-mannosaminuronate dehydrogenase